MSVTSSTPTTSSARSRGSMGIKTGHTADAGYVLVSQGTRDGLHADRLGARDHERVRARRAARWRCSTGASPSIGLVRPVHAGERFARRPVPYEVAPAVIVAARGYRTVVLARGRASGSWSASCASFAGRWPRAPSWVSCASWSRADRPCRSRWSSRDRLPAVSELKKAGHFVKRPFTLLVLALLLGGGAAAVCRTDDGVDPECWLSGRVEER